MSETSSLQLSVLHPRRLWWWSVALYVTALVVLLASSVNQPNVLLPITLLTCVGLYALADLLAGDLENALWAGYLSFAHLLVWLSQSLPAAALVITLGALLVCVLRWLYRPRFARFSKTPLQIFRLGLARAGLSMVTLVTVHGVYTLLGGALPLRAFTPPLFFAVFTALAVGFVTSQLLGLALVRAAGVRRFKPAWATSLRGWMLGELLLLVLTGGLPISIYQISEWFAVTAVLLVSFQAVRYYQVFETRQQLVRRVQELSTLNSIGQTIAGSLVLQDLLASIYDHVHPLIDGSTFFIALYDSDTQTLDFRLAMERGVPLNWQARPLDQFSTDYVVRTRQPLHLRASEFERMGHLGIRRRHEKYRVYLGVPLLVGDKVVGAMGVLSDEREDAFSTGDQKILETVASQAALAVRNAVLYDRSQMMAENLALINRSVQNVMFNMDSTHGMEVACQTAMKITGGDAAAVFTLDMNNRQQLRLACDVHMPQSFTRSHAVVPYDSEHFRGGPHIVNDARLASGAYSERLAAAGIFSYAEIPLRSGSAAVGFLGVYHQSTHVFRGTEVDLLETLAIQITAALDNAELLRALELYASEQAQLVHLSRTSVATLALNEVVDGITTQIRQMMNVDRVEVALVVPGKERVQFYGGTPQVVALPALKELTAAHPNLVMPQVFQRGSAPLPSPVLSEMMQRHGDATMALMPMIINSSAFGLMLLFAQETRVFSDNELKLLEMAINQVAAQFYNARQFTITEQDRKARLEQLSLLENIAQQITSALDQNRLITNVLEAALTATQADVAELCMITDSDEFWVIRRFFDGQDWQQVYETLPRDAGVIGRVARTGGVAIVGDNRSDPDYRPQPSGGHFESSVCVPLVKEGNIIGVLNLESRQPDFFTAEQASFLSNIAGHAVISIDNARLLEDRQREIDTLKRLRQLAILLTTTSDVHSAAEAILRAAADMVGAQDAAMFSYNPENDEILLLAGVRREPQRGFIPDTLIRGKLAYRVAQSEDLQLIEDLRAYAPYEFVDTRDYCTLIAVPVRRGERITEIICLGFTVVHPLVAHEETALDLLSVQAAGHMENALLNERIRSGNTRMRAILDSTRDGVILLDRGGMLIEFNPSAEHLLGVSLEDYRGQRFTDALATMTRTGDGTFTSGYRDTELAELLRILENEPERITRRQFSRSGQAHYVYIEEIGSPVRDAHHLIIGRLLVLRDITEQKQLESYRDELSHMIVHDLRSPLSSVISALTLSLESIKDPGMGYMLDTTLDVSLESAHRMMRLVDSLLDIAKMEDPNRPLELNVGAANLRKLVSDAHRALSSTFAQANLNVRIEIPDDLPMVNVDADKVQRVLINLLDNASKFSPTGGDILVLARYQDFRRRTLVMVADSGPGIPPDQRERIFEKFTQVPGQAPRRGGKGSGLGLRFCRLAVEAHGERIWVENESPTPGACFAFTLPVVPDGAGGMTS